MTAATAPPPAMTSVRGGGTGASEADLLAEVVGLVGKDLAACERLYAEELASSHPAVRDVRDHVAKYRGKRLRPILTLLAGAACGGVNAKHHTLAAVVEMVHAATLVHDDVLDGADVRRHVATVHSRWNPRTAVLFGDFLFTHAFHLAATVDAAACRAIGAATNAVCEGELTQIHERGNVDLTEAEYFRIVAGKTAALTAVSAELGAVHAGADAATAAALRGYGEDLGVAFQIADDLLDLVGEEGCVGKTLGSDLVEKKLTLPIIRLRDRLPHGKVQELKALLADPTADARDRLLPLLKQTGALESAAATARERAAAAIARLDVLPDSPAKGLLERLARFSVRRGS
ncbi:polyprenyl synthetase family protein [Alienimonas californiensis]|uniref:All-trans-nonaprenyl-diphosphate synthase (Geranyl-diphosphate specific) n=1 Tax=Alienimonas californiensis TaxID=2527989 RepID=A0A517PFF5_9PLAN|nr:polyprenyl synthetase family protein [Alienimonas californiensis]QDT18095.1 All-trans-nonaprenyl-diphosphate synthase (geranyl-diphosphate specific) [Alienimonas californiensis]